ncbi:hypothetical protein TNIN_387711 [Trichonephila inaurata madagascariensis]|uniref:Uncharacterized protein n=1 Tax=Trichonephila inaurata madagascariensis TaxID=2747483 RepID=A0A8X6YQU2_9ARAC|nr:hypothetical protein TNIN_387711 [Trichonephila inaurata madagascariensis]
MKNGRRLAVVSSFNGRMASKSSFYMHDFRKQAFRIYWLLTLALNNSEFGRSSKASSLWFHVLRMKPYYDPDLRAHFNDSVASDDRRFGESAPSTGRNDYAGPTTRSRSKALRHTR